MNFRLNKIYTGLAISPSFVNAVQIRKNKTQWELLNWAHHAFEEERLSYSFREKRVPDFQKLAMAISEVMQSMEKKRLTIGLALPNEVIKVSLKHFENLPETGTKINEMVTWEMEKALQLPHASARIDYFQPDKSKDTLKPNLLTAIGVDDVLSEYEVLCSQMELEPALIAPTAICQ